MSNDPSPWEILDKSRQSTAQLFSAIRQRNEQQLKHEEFLYDQRNRMVIAENQLYLQRRGQDLNFQIANVNANLRAQELENSTQRLKIDAAAAQTRAQMDQLAYVQEKWKFATLGSQKEFGAYYGESQDNESAERFEELNTDYIQRILAGEDVDFGEFSQKTREIIEEGRASGRARDINQITEYDPKITIFGNRFGLTDLAKRNEMMNPANRIAIEGVRASAFSADDRAAAVIFEQVNGKIPPKEFAGMIAARSRINGYETTRDSYLRSAQKWAESKFPAGSEEEATAHRNIAALNRLASIEQEKLDRYRSEAMEGNYDFDPTAKPEEDTVDPNLSRANQIINNPDKEINQNPDLAGQEWEGPTKKAQEKEKRIGRLKGTLFQDDFKEATAGINVDYGGNFGWVSDYSGAETGPATRLILRDAITANILAMSPEKFNNQIRAVRNKLALYKLSKDNPLEITTYNADYGSHEARRYSEETGTRIVDIPNEFYQNKEGRASQRYGKSSFLGNDRYLKLTSVDDLDKVLSKFRFDPEAQAQVVANVISHLALRDMDEVKEKNN